MTTAPYPTRPVLAPLVGSLLDSVENTQVDNIGWLDTGDALWESFGHLTFGHSPTFPCADGWDVVKTLDQGAEWVSGFRFGAYGGTTCKAVGQDMADFKAQVDAAFELGESTAVEAALMAIRFRAAAGDENAPNGEKKWTDPVDITPAGGAVKPGVGVALLEGWMAPRYLGRPVLHLPTVIASLILGVDGAEIDASSIRTRLGSQIINGVGYDEPNTGPDGEPAEVGEKWLYATGALKVLRSRSVLRQAFDQTNNDVVTLAERAYIAAAEGPTAAVRVQVTA